MSRLRIATRASKLALIQARQVGRLLGVPVALVPMSTQGDRTQGSLEPANKGWFTDDIRDAVARGDADIAVHSAKDLPSDEHAALVLAAIPAREDPRDVLVGSGQRVGTSSLRRAAQLRALGRGYDPLPIRGNVDTRLGKLDAGEYDAVLLALAGLRRLGLAHRVTEVLDPSLVLPAPGQGALAVECRAADAATRALVTRIEDRDARRCFDAERALMLALDADCKLPLGALATAHGDRIHLRGRVLSEDGASVLDDDVTGDDPVTVAAELTARLTDRGAAELMAAARAR